jgi:thiol-disulfide isomerase/thioredoxin
VRVEALENERSVGGGAPVSPDGASTWQAAGGLAVGATAPTFALEDLQGETLTLDSLRQAGKPVMLLFTDPRCGLSNALLPEVGRWQEEYANRLSIALVSRGDPEGAIASPMAGGAESIRPFGAQAVAAPANVPLLPRAPAPRAAQEGQPCPNCARSAVAEWGLLTPLLTPLRALHAETTGNHQQRNQLR